MYNPPTSTNFWSIAFRGGWVRASQLRYFIITIKYELFNIFIEKYY